VQLEPQVKVIVEEMLTRSQAQGNQVAQAVEVLEQQE
jgi:hypothetical protein